jgi:transposase-like protein
VSAQSLQRSLEIGSYQTAWAMLHRLRSVLIRPGRERLSGIVEVDETFIGGEEPGLRGGRAKGKKSLVAVAVELREPKGYGRCRMTIIPDASGSSLHTIIADHVEAGSQVITDGWQGYRKIDKLGYVHDRRSQRAARARGDDPAELLPAVHRVASLAKRWLLGTHQGSVDAAHLQSYLDEFVFRFNRRTSRSRGLVFTESWNSPSAMSPSATTTSSSPRHRPRTHRQHRAASGTRRASTAPKQRDPGDPPDQARSA